MMVYMQRFRRWVLNGLTLLSLLLCAFYGLLAFAWDRLWVEGQIATINAKDQIIHDPYSLTEAKICLGVAIVFAILPLVRWFFRIRHEWRESKTRTGDVN